MLHITDLREGLPLFKALGSDIRVEILRMLAHHQHLNMNEIAEKLHLTNGAITMHVKKLEECGLIGISTATGKHGTQKICSLRSDKLVVDLREEVNSGLYYETELPVGHYSDYQILPTCGIATRESLIGEVDEPRYFAAPERMQAGVLWFTKGYVEYRIPNYLKTGQKPLELQISMELSSEAPGICEDWPSDIHFNVNGTELGFWTSPGDFGEVRGLFTPGWWFPNWNQYGLLKLLSINAQGTFVDGLQISEVCLADLQLNHRSDIAFRMTVPDTTKNVGGMTVFGRGFGNYNQGIKVRMAFEEASGA